MQIKIPIPKLNFFGGGDVRTDVKWYGQTDRHTDGRRGGGDTFHMSKYHLSQCNAMQPSSIVQFRTAVGWSTKKNRKLSLKKHRVRDSPTFSTNADSRTDTNFKRLCDLSLKNK